MRIYICYFNVEPEDYVEELEKAAPYLNRYKHSQVMSDNSAYILVDSEEELNSLFYQTIGDDGPTSENPYDGPMRVYALTCNPDGILMNENT